MQSLYWCLEAPRSFKKRPLSEDDLLGVMERKPLGFWAVARGKAKAMILLGAITSSSIPTNIIL